MKNQKTKKILKIARVVYDVLSAIFIIFISVALIVGNNGKQTEKAIKNAINHPVVLEKQPNYAYVDNSTIYLTSELLYNYDFIYGLNDSLYTTYSLSRSTWGNGLGSTYPLATYLGTYNGWQSQPGYNYSFTSFGLYTNGTIQLTGSNNLYIQCRGSTDYSYIETWYGSNVHSIGYLKFINCTQFFIDYVNNFGGGYTEEDLQREYTEGYADGYDVGSSEGYTEGYADGYDYAIEEMNDRTDALTLAQNYDFRQWIGKLDLVSGAIAYDIPDSEPAISLVYKGMSWLSNGNIYNAIRLILVRLDSMNALVTNYDITSGQYSGYTARTLYGNDYSNYCMLTSVAYLHYDTNDNLDLSQVVYEAPVLSDVLVHDVDTELDFKALAYNLNNNTIDPSYRYLQGIIQEDNNKLDTPVYKNVTLYDLLSMQLTQAVNVGVGDSNIFGLLSQGFNTMGNIMSIQIIPNITIGLLLLLPLVVTIIILIFKMVRK